MFSSKLRKESKQKLQAAVNEQKMVADRLRKETEGLYHERTQLKTDLDSAMNIINAMRNVPENLELQVQDIKVSLDRYEGLLDIADAEYRKDSVQAGGAAAGGVAAGVGVAALAPTAAMAVATTFGTAATGTAISALSGAAATNAALAWLGGGALVAGGTGMAGGEALLALAGPLGWAIGGVTLLGGGVMANGKNKKAAQKMNEQAIKITAVAKTQDAMDFEVRDMIRITKLDSKDIQERTATVKENYSQDFKDLTNDQILKMGTFVNNIHAASRHLNSVIGDDGKFEEVDEQDS